MCRLSPDVLVYDTVSPADPQISPDGRQLVYALGTADKERDRGTSQLWLADIDGSNPRRLTRSGDRNREPRWSPDGRSIAFVSDRLRDASGLFILPIDAAGEARELTHHRTPIGALAWSPDGASIAYTKSFDPNNPDEQPPAEHRAPKVKVTRRLDYKQDNRGWLNDVRTQVFVVRVDTGERKMLTQEPHDLAFPLWSPDGSKLVAKITSGSGTFARLAIIDVQSEGITLVGAEEGNIAVWSWSPGGDRIFFAGDTEPSAGADLFVYDLGTDSVRRLTTDLPCTPDAGFPTVIPPSQPVWLNDSEVLFHAMRAGASAYYRFNVETADLTQEHLTRSLSVGFSLDAAGRYVAQVNSGLDTIGEIAVYDRQTGQRKMVTNYNAGLLDERSPVTWERFDIDRDGTIVEAWLLKPPDFDPAQTYPVILDVHGGPHGFYGYGFNAIQQLLANNGFLVVFSNPRGSASYGREFAHMVRGDWGGQAYLDLMAVVDRVLEEPYADRKRTGIWGYSYGGYMTAWAISQTNRFQAAVCGAPCFDLESMYGTSDIAYSWGPYQWGGKPHEASEAFAAHSPSTFAHRTRTPTLIVHGEADERCPVGQGEQMFVALAQAGCEVEFARYPGGPHAMLRVGPPSHRADFMQRVVDWFNSHLGGPDG